MSHYWVVLYSSFIFVDGKFQMATTTEQIITLDLYGKMNEYVFSETTHITDLIELTMINEK